MSPNPQLKNESNLKTEKDQLILKTKIEILQGVFNILRDASIFIIFLLLLIWPQRINSILTNAGVNEVNTGVIKWKSALGKNNNVLTKTEDILDSTLERIDEQNRVFKDLKSNSDELEEPLKNIIETALQDNEKSQEEILSTRAEVKNRLTKNQALLLEEKLLNLGINKLDIYYPKDNQQARTLARLLENELQKRLPNIVVVYENMNSQRFSQYNSQEKTISIPSYKNEEEEIVIEVKQLLEQILEEPRFKSYTTTSIQYEKQREDTTPTILSIFVNP